jgi:dehydrogenase/reductase SDR family member 7B
MKRYPLNGKVVWITGASSGIGRALTEEAARRGARLILSGRSEKRLAETASACKAAACKASAWKGTASHADAYTAAARAPAEAALLPFDLADARGRQEAANRAPGIFGTIDLLILNAGVSQRSKFIDTSSLVFDRVMETNFRASVDLVRSVLPPMIERNSGAIVCVSSVAGLMGAPWRTAYSASKHALGGFFASLRAELVGKRILISMIYPGFVRTAISQNALMGDGSKHGILDPLQATGQDPALTAKKCLDAIEVGRLELKVAFDAKARLGVFLFRHFPAIFAKTISRHGGL